MPQPSTFGIRYPLRHKLFFVSFSMTLCVGILNPKIRVMLSTNVTLKTPFSDSDMNLPYPFKIGRKTCCIATSFYFKSVTYPICSKRQFMCRSGVCVKRVLILLGIVNERQILTSEESNSVRFCSGNSIQSRSFYFFRFFRI